MEPEVLSDLLILFAIVLGVNLLPAFGPPTWSVIILYGLNSQLPLPALVLTGAVAAALGRFLLAYSFRHLAGWFSEKTKRNLKAARAALERKKRNAFLALGLFALSPVPSAQLFEAAGLAGVRLLPFTAAFFAGRIVSYSIYAFTAQEVRRSSLGDAFRDSLTSPIGLAVQIGMIVLLVAFARIDWAKRLGGTS
jgi:uncharacterized membrane protein YdjX (TVP38/TMEM64 family)